jgi:PTS system N-acetylglucosamine-specific IIC component
MFNGLQQIGRALMLPIAVLPVAGLLLRLGQPDLLDLAPMAAAGNAIFSNLGLLFAIGVAIGLARENHGAAGLASVVGYLVTTKGAEVLIGVPPDVLAGLAGQARDLAGAAYKARELAKLSVPAGILSGLIAGMLYNRFSGIELPSYLAFFGGRRFVPIASGVAGLALAGLFGWGWPVLEQGMDALSRGVLGSGELGLFAYGVLNRLLIITGLHHVLNNIAWFLLGDFNGVTGDLNRYFAGDPSAGAFMAGFFPVMMFGLPAACLAMYHAASPDRRRAVAGLLLSMALTAALTGITEPIEFTFVFLAPALFALHALLTGLAMVLMDVLGAKLGFSFSAGLFDYVLGYSRATNPWLLLPVGAVYFGAYYGLFRYFIARFDLRTPGRGPAETAPAAAASPESAAGGAHAFVEALGGAANLTSIDACTTRLRLAVASPERVDETALRQLGARGIVRLSANQLQVILGPQADQVAGAMRDVLRAGSASGGAPALLAALGGVANVAEAEVASTRLCFTVRSDSDVDDAALAALGLRGIARPSANRVHAVIGPRAAEMLIAVRALGAGR